MLSSFLSLYFRFKRWFRVMDDGVDEVIDEWWRSPKSIMDRQSELTMATLIQVGLQKLPPPPPLQLLLSLPPLLRLAPFFNPMSGVVWFSSKVVGESVAVMIAGLCLCCCWCWLLRCCCCFWRGLSCCCWKGWKFVRQWSSFKSSKTMRMGSDEKG